MQVYELETNDKQFTSFNPRPANVPGCPRPAGELFENPQIYRLPG